ncbi:MAG: response regulator [Planctomycetes bacterium]|nr:response regulator [Planctomycetota bacterium]
MTATNILIVEDEGIVAQDLVGQLRALGYGIAGVAESATEAVRLAEAGRPDLVLMDIRLRGSMDGIEAADQIRARLALPVVYLTAHADDGTLQRARKTEPFGYLLKPFQERELRTVVEMALYKHQAEQRLRQSERRFQATLQSIAEAVLTVSDRGQVLFVNPAAERLSGRSAGELSGHALTEVLQLVDRDGRRFVPTPDQAFNARLRRHGGELLDVEGHVASSRPIDEGDPGLVYVVRDVTERLAHERVQRETRDRLLRVQKLESLGQLAGGIAHDFNNLLTAILGNAELALRAMPKDRVERPAIECLVAAARQAADLAGQMLVYSGRAVFEPEAVDLAALVGDSQSLLRAVLPANVEMRLHLPTELPPVDGDRLQLQRLLLNLVLNAGEAMPAGGRVDVRVMVRECDREFVAQGFSDGARAPGRYVGIEVADTGVGIAPERIGRLFDPFFTTKQGHRGLGLPAVLATVRSHGGVLRVDSAPGVGARFSAWLPVRTGSVARPVPVPVRVPQGEVVMVIEDQEHLRELVRSVLANEGYPVLLAGGFAAARRLLPQQAANLRLLLVDLTLGDGNALELLPEVRRRCPDVPIVLLSSHTDAVVADALARGQAQAFLPKPFGVQELLAVVRRFAPAR